VDNQAVIPHLAEYFQNNCAVRKFPLFSCLCQLENALARMNLRKGGSQHETNILNFSLDSVTHSSTYSCAF